MGEMNMASLSDAGLDGPVGVREEDLRAAAITVLETAKRDGWTGEEFEGVLAALTGLSAAGLRRLL